MWRRLLNCRSRSPSRRRERSRGRSEARPAPPVNLTARRQVSSEARLPNPAPLTTTEASITAGLNHLTPNLADGQLDIVAIHGINGDAYKTWTQDGALWLRDFLPEDIPGANVFSFGYNAQVAFTTSKETVEDFARLLLVRLKGCRTKERQCRPLIFICHSMGGIVVKQALVIAQLEANNYPFMKDSIKGILFLSTPHRGSDSVKWPLILANIVNIFSSGTARNDLLKSLEKNSEELLAISTNFRNQVRGTKIISCYETNTTSPLRDLIVDKQTGFLGFPDEELIPMSGCDHRTVCRFSSKDDQNYQAILYEIRSIVDVDTCTPQYTQDQKDCLKSLHFREIEDRQVEITRASANTCEWLLKHRKFQEWLRQNRGLLWIAGKPGAGKSTLLNHALRNISKIETAAVPDKVLLISFFFHGRGTELQRTPLGLFRSILHQLLAKIPSLLSDLVRTFKERCDARGKPGEAWNWHTADLQDIFEASLPNVLAKYSIRIFVDALDECQKEAAISVVEKFQNLISNTPSTSSLLSICFTCRHYPILALDHISKIYVERENSQDIATYVRRELKDSKGRFSDAVISRAQGVFQWAFLVVRQVSNLEREGKTSKEINMAIQEIPRELDELYRKLLGGINHWEKPMSLKLMQWVCFAIEPLSLSELRFAMVVDTDTRYTSLRQCQDTKEYIDENEIMERRVKHLSCGLIEIQERDKKQIAQFIHQSVNDFFQRDGLQILDGNWESPDRAIGDAHYRLSRSCIRYLAMEEICELEAEQRWRDHEFDSKFPFLRYATTAWVIHSQRAEAKNTSQADLLDCLHWSSNNLLQRWVHIFQEIDIYSHGCPAKGTTLLHILSRYNLISLLSAFLESLDNMAIKVDSIDKYGLTPVSYAESKIGVGILPKELIDINARDEFGATALHWAAINGHERVVSLLIKDADSDIRDEFGGTPLTWAIENGSKAVIELLLMKGPKLDFQYIPIVSDLYSEPRRSQIHS